MSEQILTIPEIALVPSGAPSGTAGLGYEVRTVNEHAIRVTDGVAEPTTLCGEYVHGQVLDVAFETVQVSTRCARCAELLGL